MATEAGCVGSIPTVIVANGAGGRGKGGGELSSTIIEDET